MAVWAYISALSRANCTVERSSASAISGVFGSPAATAGPCSLALAIQQKPPPTYTEAQKKEKVNGDFWP